MTADYSSSAVPGPVVAAVLLLLTVPMAGYCGTLGAVHDEIADRVRAADSVVHVSLDGSDEWSGGLAEPNAEATDGPFATVLRAREAVRELIREGLEGDVVVRIGPGTHYVGQTFELGPEDSGDQNHWIIYSGTDRGDAVLSGGRPVTGWRRLEDDLWCADIPEVAEGTRTFRQLFVDGKRQVQARYPDYDPTDVLRKGWLHAGPPVGLGIILAGIAKQGDFVQYRFSVPASATYHLWLGYAGMQSDLHKSLGVTIDGEAVQLGEMPASGSWRTVSWARGGAIALTAGDHVLRCERIPAPDRIVHLDAFVLTDDDGAQPLHGAIASGAEGHSQVVIQAEGPRADGKASHVGGFQTFACPGAQYPDSRHLISCAPGTVRASWGQDPGAQVHIFAAWGWFNEIARIVAVDPEESTIRIAGRECQGDIREGNRFFVSNVFDELDQPGEWYLDRRAGRLYYRPVERPPTQSTVVAPVVDTLVSLRAPLQMAGGARHIAIHRVSIAHTDYTADHVAVRTAQDAAVLLENAHDCAILDCRFDAVGGSGIRLHLDCRGNTIAGNLIEEAGGNGVLLTAATVSYGRLMTPGEEAADYAPIENTIQANTIRRCGRIHKYVAGVHLDSRPQSMAQQAGNTVVGNRIEDMPRNGIFAFKCQGGNLIQGNTIRNIMLQSDDGGGIHIAAGADIAPNIIRGNHISDVHGWRQKPDGDFERQIGIGVYLDNETGNCIVEANTIEGTSSGGVLLNGGSNNRIEGNVIADDAAQALFISNYAGTMHGNVIRRNVLLARAEQPRMYRLKKLTEEALSEADHNLYWARGAETAFDPIGGWQQWQGRGYDHNSVVSDPMVLKRTADGYKFSPDSPVTGLGPGPAAWR